MDSRRKGIKETAKRILPEKLWLFLKNSYIDTCIKKIMREKGFYSPALSEQGVNLIGSIRAEMGLGQSCRLVAQELEAAGIPFSVYNVNFDGDLRENDGTYDKYLSEDLPYGINIFHVNPCELAKVAAARPQLWKGRYNIAFWLWELEEFPPEWIRYCALFDEIWTPSEFAGRGVRKVTDMPVKTMPYEVSAPYDPHCGRTEFHLPDDKFLYLIMYDSNSTSGRKNPGGAIEAYKWAFPEENADCGLVIKINNALPDDIESLRCELRDYQNVYFITEVLEKPKVNSLIRCVDVFVSLHRAEGFGLVMAEAMLLGTPVIATNWSANTEFMSEDAACMVDYQLVQIERQELFYKKGLYWAEPDTKEAAEYMSRLWSDEAYYQSRAAAGLQCIQEKLNNEKIKQIWRLALQKIPEAKFVS